MLTEEITKAVRTNFKNGANLIKILATGAVLSKGIPPGAQQYSEKEMRAAEGIKAAIRAGVHTIDHDPGCGARQSPHRVV